MVTIMLGLTVTMNNALFETTQRTNTNATLVVVDTVIYKDLNNAVPVNTAINFMTAESQKMVFKTDISGGLNQLETVTYDATETYTRTEWNPDTKQNVDLTLHRLYRKTGSSTPVLMCGSLLKVCFTYSNSDGRLTTSPDSVDGIRVRLVARVEGVNKGIMYVQTDSRAFPQNFN